MVEPLLNDVASRTEGPSLRVPPHSVEAEQAVLGGVLIDNGAWDRIVGILTAAHFYRNDHRVVFDAVSGLCDEGRPCDAVTVAERLERNGQLESSGGLAYLAELTENTPSAANIVAYAEIVRERAVLRELIRTSTEIAESAFRPRGAELSICSTTRNGSSSRLRNGEARAGVNRSPSGTCSPA